MAPSVGGASVLAVVAVAVSRQLIDIETLRASNGEVGTYIQALGTIYGIVAAFVIYVVWGQFNDARTQVEREASEIVDLYRIADGLPDTTRAELQTKLGAYIDAVLDVELEAIDVHGPTPQETTTLVDELWVVLHRCEPVTESGRALHVEALGLFNELSNARTARLTSARTRMPFALRLLLYIGGGTLVLSMCLLAIDRFWVHALVTAALAAAVAHVLYIAEDLDDPFDGNWRVPREAFQRARAYMARRRAQTAVGLALAAETAPGEAA
jgi:hypothetical protein